MPITLLSNQRVLVTALDFDSGDQEIAQPQGQTFTWSIANTSIATLDNTTGTSVNVIAQAVGSTSITVSDGTHNFTDTITVQAPAVASIGIEYGTPAAKS